MTDEVQPSLPIGNAIDTEALELDAGEDDALLSDLVASPRPITSDRSQTPRGGWSTPRSVTPIINNITLPDPYSNAPSQSVQRPDSASSALTTCTERISPHFVSTCKIDIRNRAEENVQKSTRA